MKKGFLLLAALFAAGAVCAETDKPEIKILEQSWFDRMDTDRDGKVSETEYVEVGIEYLKQKGKRISKTEMLEKFAGYDRDRDGFITDADPTYRDPKELLAEQIMGCWSCEQNSKGSISFLFMEDSQADVIQKGESMREKAAGMVKYHFVMPGRIPTRLDITVADGTPSEYHIKAIIEFLPDDQLKMRMFMGSDFTPFPKEFVKGPDQDTIILTKCSSVVSAQ